MNLGLSKRGNYVVRSAVCLASAYGSGLPKKLHEVSSEMGVPRTFVSQILGDLVRAGIARSSFGKDGGYRLACPPEAISLLQIIEAAEGPLVPARCVVDDGPCRWDAVCPLHDTWASAAAALRTELGATSLAEVRDRTWVGETGAHLVAPGPRRDTHQDPQRRAPRSVAVADAVQVELAVSRVATRLRSGASWLSPHAEAASTEAASTGAASTEAASTGAARVRVGPGPRWLGKTVVVHLGKPEENDEGFVIPFSWEATGPSGLFPRLVGELRLSALDPERCELAMSGRYQPPLGRAGHLIDDALLSHVAHATVRVFLRRVARDLEEAASRVASGQVSPESVTTSSGAG